MTHTDNITRRLCAALLYFALCLFVSGCGNKEAAEVSDTSDQSPPESAVSEPPSETVTDETSAEPVVTQEQAPQTSNEVAEKKTTSQPTFDPASYTGPTFELETMNGSVVKFTDYLGKGPVALNFWGTWCPPCRRELPDFKQVYSDYRTKGVEIVGVSIRDTKEKLQSFTAENGIEWPQLIGLQETLIDFGNITAVPTTILYDRAGKEIYRHRGPLSDAEFRQQLDMALAASTN